MAAKSREELLATIICGKSLEVWDCKWEPVAGGFSADHMDLVGVPGLARAVLKDQVMYILRATERRGLQKGLQRIKGRDQTGNSGFGAQMIREHIDALKLEILPVPASEGSVECIFKLKSRMIDLHNPVWDKAHQKRLKALKSGNLG